MMSKAPFLLCVTTPSSGADRLCTLIAECAPELNYAGEFFTAEEFQGLFGSGPPYWFGGIGIGPDHKDECDLMDDAFERSNWRETGRRFALDCWNPRKIAWYQRHEFHVFSYFRSFEDIFAKSAQRLSCCDATPSEELYEQYESLYAAARLEGDVSAYDSPTERLHRCQLGWLWAWSSIVKSRAPTLLHDAMSAARAAPAHLLDNLEQAGLGRFVSCSKLAARIVEERSACTDTQR